jgi:O-antigen ligase
VTGDREVFVQNRTLDWLQDIWASSNRWLATGVVVLVCLLGGLLVGALFGYLGPVIAVALILALVGGLLMLRSTQWGLLAVIAVICLLPFGSLPVKIGFTPTFLDVVFGVVFFVWLARIATRQQGEFIASPLALPVLLFMLLAVISFTLGLAHASPTPNALRRFGETMLSIALFFLVINCVRKQREVEQLILGIMGLGTLEAAIGIVFYVLPHDWTVRILSRLAIFGYPSGSNVLRYIYDAPERPLRAIATSVDPNILGALLVMVGALVGAQLFARRPLIARKWLAAMLGTILLCLYLTYSRGSMVGLAVALSLLGLVKYRRLLLVLVILGLLFWFLPQTQPYVSHFIKGLEGEELSMQMRLGEYKDVLRLIQRYPWLGVGFIDAPDIDLYLGVSMLYLIIAAEMGLVGLAAFLLAMLVFFVYVGLAFWRARADPRLEAILLGLLSAIAGALVGGLADHTMFSYPHAVAIFWLLIGLGVTTSNQ